LKHITASHASIPVHDGGFLLLLNTGFTSPTPFGAYASSIPIESKSAIDDAPKPQMTSARGLSFSASTRAVMTPVESRTHAISTSGLAFSNASLYGPS
jgi:hypothetical protein